MRAPCVMQLPLEFGGSRRWVGNLPWKRWDSWGLALGRLCQADQGRDRGYRGPRPSSLQGAECLLCAWSGAGPCCTTVALMQGLCLPGAVTSAKRCVEHTAAQDLSGVVLQCCQEPSRSPELPAPTCRAPLCASASSSATGTAAALTRRVV